MIPDKEEADRSEKVGKEISRSLGIAWLRCLYDQAGVPRWVVFERIFDAWAFSFKNRPVDLSAVVEIPSINVADIV